MVGALGAPVRHAESGFVQIQSFIFPVYSSIKRCLFSSIFQYFDWRCYDVHFFDVDYSDKNIAMFDVFCF